MIVICIKQHLSNISSSIHEKVKQQSSPGWKNSEDGKILICVLTIAQNVKFDVIYSLDGLQ